MPVLAEDQEMVSAQETPPPAPFKHETQHRLKSGGTDISYTATAEEIYLRDGEDNATASFFTISYIRNGTARPEDRPVTFVFNGGPGSASIWLHLGLVGRKSSTYPPMRPTPVRRPTV
jgi:carboxypeptidase C (cathepsin A)